MKQKSLLKTMLLLCALIAGSSNVWADDPTVTITISSFTDLPTSGSATYGTYSWTANGVSGKGQICANSSSTSLQMNGGNANGKIIYNTTAIPGSIKKINLIKASGSNRSYSVYGRTSAFSGSGTEYGTLIATSNIADGTGRDYTVATGDYNYFVVVNNASNAAYLASITVTYEVLTKHTLSSAVSPTGVGTVTLGATSIGEGKSTTIEATVTNPAYRFKNWTKTSGTIADADAASTTFTMGTADATVTANFELIPTHKANVTAPSGGTITIKDGDDVIAAGSDVLEGTELTIIAAAGAGKKFGSWSLTGAVPASTTDATTTFTMGTTDVTIAATFDDATTHPIHWSVNGSVVKTDNVVEGEAIAFDAPASGIPAGYIFKGWSASAILTPQAVAPAYVSSATSTAEVTYYAVMAVKTASAPDTYEKLANNSFDADATYVMAGEQSGSVTTLWYLKSYESVDADIAWGLSTSAPATEAPVTFKLSGTAAALIAKDNSGNYLAKSSADKKFAMSSTSSTVYLHTDGAIKTASDGWLMRYNYNSGNGGFRWYTGTTGQQAYFYKVIDNNVYKNYCTTLPTDPVSVTPGKKYTTLTSVYPLDFSGVAELEAYIVKDDDLSDDAVTLTQVNKVPANTGLVLKASSTGSPIDVPVLEGAADDVTGNLMAGSATETTAIAANAGYILKDGVFHPASAGTLPAGKAYLNIAVSSAPVLYLDFGGTTGINTLNVERETLNGEVYNLNGQRVAQPTKGLYIVNGKKVIIK